MTNLSRHSGNLPVAREVGSDEMIPRVVIGDVPVTRTGDKMIPRVVMGDVPVARTGDKMIPRVVMGDVPVTRTGDKMIPRVVMGNVPATEFQDLVFNHDGHVSHLFGTNYIEWHRRPHSDLGDIIAVETNSFYHEYVKERVAEYIEEGEHQAHVPECRRLMRIGQVMVESESRMAKSDGGFSPLLSDDELSVLQNAVTSRPRQTLVVEVGAHQGLDQILDKIQNLYREMTVYPQLVLFVDVKPFIHGQPIAFDAIPKQVPDLCLKLYLFTRYDDFQQPIQILNVGDCDEHGQVHGLDHGQVCDRHRDQGAVNLMIPTQTLYYGAASPIPGDWLQVHFGRLADDLRLGLERYLM
ncbi:hypothetical protein R1sor_008285 [Riccia sorocarpa]|uniref:Uncharacterized protein n=1 Tax=Riccia sorocarpa TaxID=122646 RepID=A0ABD3HWD8_9MARC